MSFQPMSMHSAQDKGKEIAFFDGHAESDEYDVFTPQANDKLIAAFVRLSGLPPGAHVADLGCGSGVFTELLRQAGYESTGLWARAILSRMQSRQDSLPKRTCSTKYMQTKF